MSRLIDAEIAYDKIAEQETSYYMDMEGVQAGLDETPTVDAVEVVRCDECAYRRRCMLQHFVESNAVDGTKIDWSEWYCADGVRDISKSDERREKE